MALDLITRDAAVDRAHRPVGLSPSPDMSYTVTSVEVLPVLKPIRRIRAMTDSTRYEASLVSIMMSFVVLCALDLACVPLWAALPGCAVIVAAMLVSVVVLAHNNAPARHPSTSGKTTRRR